MKHLLHPRTPPRTLLAVCPNSEAVLEAAVKAAGQFQTPMLFAATLNQIDRVGGYTHWTPAQFIQQMNHYAMHYGVPRQQLFPCLDHGGAWLKDVHHDLSYEATLAEVKLSISDMIQAGYQLLHMDATVDLHQTLSMDTVIARTIELVQHAEAERRRLNLPPIDYEVGTEEVHGGLADLDYFKMFLQRLFAALGDLPKPIFVVAQVGTNLHTTDFDAETARKLHAIVSPYGMAIKAHYSDWVATPEQFPLAGIGGANVGPEFTAVEVKALAELDAGFLPVLEQAVDESNRWQKWRLPDESGFALSEFSPSRRAWIINTCARYVWTQPTVQAARQHLYERHPHAHQRVLDQLVAAMERYIIAFNLKNTA